MKRFMLVVLLAPLLMAQSCAPTEPPVSRSGGVRAATAEIQVQSSGLTIEQENIQRRLMEDNAAGSIKHLYIISAYSGDVILYSTVRGKVTSSGKRLSPYEVSATDGQYVSSESRGIPVNIGGRTKYTPEVLQDDGTYGSSIDYVYWWDSRDVYHQHYIAGGQIVHLSSAPMRVGKIIINIEDGAAQ